MKTHGIARIGKDAEIRYIPSGEAVINLSLAFTRRLKAEKLTDWVDATFWGKRAETLAPYLLKGTQIGVDLEDLHIETYAKQDGTQGFKLAAKVVDVTLISSQQTPAPQPSSARQATRPPEPRSQPPSRHAPAPRPASGFDDMDDCPF